jgi:hypothetical protein
MTKNNTSLTTGQGEFTSNTSIIISAKVDKFFQNSKERSKIYLNLLDSAMSLGRINQKHEPFPF